MRFLPRRFARSLPARLLLGLFVMLLAVSGGVQLGQALPAQAAPAQPAAAAMPVVMASQPTTVTNYVMGDTTVSMSLTRTFTGTGHGTADACFINAANGYTPGDETAADDYVCLGDSVGMQLDMNFKTGSNPPTVQFHFNVSTSLGYSNSYGMSADFCAADGVYVLAASVAGQNCTMTLAPNSSFSLKRSGPINSSPYSNQNGVDYVVAAEIAVPSGQPRVSAAMASYTVLAGMRVDPYFDGTYGVPTRFENVGGVLYAFAERQINYANLPAPGYSPGKGYLQIEPPRGTNPTDVARQLIKLDTSSLPAGAQVLVYQSLTNSWAPLASDNTFPLFQVVDQYGRVGGIRSVKVRIPVSQLAAPGQSFSKSYTIRIAQDTPTLTGVNGEVNLGGALEPGAELATCSEKMITPGVRTYGSSPNNDCISYPFYWSKPGTLLWKTLNGTISNTMTPLPPGQAPGASVMAAGGYFTAQIRVAATMMSTRVGICDSWNSNYQTLDLRTAPSVQGAGAVPGEFTIWYKTTTVSDASPCSGEAPSTTAGWTTDPSTLPAGPGIIQVAKVVANNPVFTDSDIYWTLPFKLYDLSRYPFAPGANYSALDPEYVDTARLAFDDAWQPDPASARFQVLGQWYLNTASDQGGTNVFAGQAFTNVSGSLASRLISDPSTAAAGGRQQIVIQAPPCVSDINAITPSYGFDVSKWDVVKTPAQLGPSGLECAADQVAGPKLVLTAKAERPYTPTGQTDMPTISGVMSARARLGAVYNVTMTTSMLGVDVSHQSAPATSTVPLKMPTVGGAFASSVVPTASIEIGDGYRLVDSFGNSTTTPLGQSQWISVLPYQGDSFGSNFHGTSTLAGVTGSDPTMVFEYTKASAASVNNDPADASNQASGATVWCTGLTGGACPSSLAEVTAVRTTVPDLKPTIDYNVVLNMATTGNQTGDVYAHRLGQGRVSGLAQPVPVTIVGKTVVVSGTISGTIWNDADHSSTREAAEALYANVPVKLFRISDNAEIATATTDATGAYSFANLHSGDYRVEVQRTGSSIPAAAISTYSYNGQQAAAASSVSQTVTLPAGSGVGSVDFGYFTPNPVITLVKKIEGREAHTGPGVPVASTQSPKVTFTVGNAGNVDLERVSVSDDTIPASSILCPATTLAVGATMECTADLSPLGANVQHENWATATGTGVPYANVPGTTVTARDNARAFSDAHPSLTVQKFVNDTEQDTAPGARQQAGVPLPVRFVVTNTGDVPLKNVRVTDTVIPANGISCPAAVIPVGESMTCTATLPTLAANTQHVNTVTATADSITLIDGTVVPVTPAKDTVYVFTGAKPSLSVVKTVAGTGEATAPGAKVPAGEDLPVVFTVTNTGDVPLAGVTVTDDTIPADRITCPATTIPVGGNLVCTATLPALAENVQHVNTVTTTANSFTELDGTVVPVAPATDTVHVFTGANPTLAVVKKINGDDANTAPGVRLDPKTDAQVTAEVTNTGKVTVTDLAVTDDVLGTLTCPVTQLAAGESTTCTTTLPGLDVLATHKDTVTVTGTGPTLADGTRADPSPVTDLAHAFAAGTTGLSIVKFFDEDDANTQPGIKVQPGHVMSVRYRVTNTGTVPLDGVKVTDPDTAAPILCPATKLAVGEWMDCASERGVPGSGEPGGQTMVGGVATATANHVLLADGTDIGPGEASDPAWAVVEFPPAPVPPGATPPAGNPPAVTPSAPGEPGSPLASTGAAWLVPVTGLGLLLIAAALVLLRRARREETAER